MILLGFLKMGRLADFFPASAIEGMLVDPVKDKKAMRRLKMEATGQKMKKGRKINGIIADKR